MNIKGDKIDLESIDFEHTNLIVKWRNNENVRKNFIFQDDMTEEMHVSWMNNKVLKNEVIQFIIVDKQTNLPVGSTFLKDISSFKAEFGIFIGDDNARGKGFGTEAAKLICEYAFSELKLHKIYLRVLAKNEAAIRSYEKVGFEKEAYLVDEEEINGKFVDVVFMAKINR